MQTDAKQTDDSTNPSHTKSSNAFLLGCTTGPVVCLFVSTLWVVTASIANGLGPNRKLEVGIAVVVILVHCLISTIIGAAVGGAVANSRSLYYSAAISAFVAFPFCIALGIFCNRSFPEEFISYGLLVTLLGTFTGMIVTVIMRRSEQRIGNKRVQIPLGEMLFVCLLFALFLMVLGSEYRRMRFEQNHPVQENGPGS